jgi:long-chain acyl-CoA synthetase
LQLHRTDRRVSTILAAFARLHGAHPRRQLIHLPNAGRSLTADDIWSAHQTYTDLFRSCGLQPGQLLLLAVGNRDPIASLFLAARALDLTTVAVDAGTTIAVIRDLCERFGVAAIVAPQGAVTWAPGQRRHADEGLEIVGGTRERISYPDTALLKLTSGSTGLPKAACTSDAQLLVDSQQICAGMGIGPDDTQIAVIPLSHAYGISVVLVPLILQGTAMVLRESFVPHQLASDVRSYGATTFPGVPYMFDYFVANPIPGGWPPGLHRLISAGARLPPETVSRFAERFGVKIHSFYGASEAGGICYDNSDTVDATSTVGVPLPGVSVTFHHDDYAPPGCGRVHVRSAAVASGYVGETAEEFGHGGFLTGDYGRFDSRGRLELTGRVSSFINVAGRKVQPAEVEDVLRQLPGVRDVRVVAAPDPQRGEQVVACIVVEREYRESVTALTVRRHCSARLAPHKIPRDVLFLDSMPLTARGKTDRRALGEAVRAQIEGRTQQLC